MFGKKKPPSMNIHDFSSKIPMIMSYLHRLLASAIGAGIAEAVWDIDVYGHRLMPWKKVVLLLWGNHFAYRCCKGAQNLAAEPADLPDVFFRWSLESFLRGLRFDMLTQVEGWGLTRCIMRSDCSCKVAAWGSWGTSLWSGEIVKLSLMLQVQVPVSWNRTT